MWKVQFHSFTWYYQAISTSFVEKTILSPMVLSAFLKSVDCRYMFSFCAQFCSIDLHGYSYASNIPSWWLSLYNKFWNRKVLKFESLQLHFCFSKLFWLLQIPCSHILILKSALSICTMKLPGIPVETALNLNINLGCTVNLKIQTYDNEHRLFPFYLELSFLSTMFCNFQSINFAFLLLNLYLNI